MERYNSDIVYFETIFKRLIAELKQKNCLSQEFEFLTKAEREQIVEEFIDGFINH